MARIDVTVRGAGVFGLACAFELSRRGARVRVVDPSGPGAGASGGVLGALAPHVPEGWNAKKQFQLEALLAAPGFWGAVEAASNMTTGYGRTGRLQPVADEAALALAQERGRNAGELWPGAVWEVVPASGGFQPASASGWLIRDTLSARLHPRRAVEALAALVEVVPEAPDEGAVLWATGAVGLEELSRAFGKQVGRGVKGQAALLDLDAREAPQLFADGVHVVPHDDGTTAVGSTDERDYTEATVPDAALDALLGKARRLVPALEGARVIERWAALRPRARSRAPMLGGWPGREGHFVANGGFKIGFGIAPGVASVMAELILEDRDTIPAGFRVEDNL